MRWSEEAWKEVDKIYNEISKSDFVVELGTGALNSERFIRYMEQDKSYSKDYSKSSALIADRAPTAEHAASFRKFSHDSMEAEKSLHNFYLEASGRDSATENLTKNVVCQKYTSLLLDYSEHKPVESAAAAILPCFWIYDLVGVHHYAMLNKLTDKSTHPYAKWIELYSCPEFTSGTQQVLDFVDELATKTTAERRREMTDIFVKATVLELSFWKISYTNDAESIVKEYPDLFN